MPVVLRNSFRSEFGFRNPQKSDIAFRGGADVNEAVSHVPEFILISTEPKWYRENRMTGKAVAELEKAWKAKDEFIVDYVRVYDIVK